MLGELFCAAHLQEDDGTQQVEAVCGSAVFPPRWRPLSAPVWKQHPLLPSPLLPLRRGPRRAGRGGGAEAVEGEDLGAGAHGGADASRPQRHLLAPLLDGLVLLLDADDGTQRGGEAGQVGGRTVPLDVVRVPVHLHLIVQLVVCAGCRRTAVVVAHLMGDRGEHEGPMFDF